MADAPSGNRKRLAPSTVVAVIAVCVTVILGGITIWQTSHFYSEQSRINEQAVLSNKIDGLTVAVQDIKVTIAQIGQRLDDHLTTSKHRSE